MLKEKNLEQFTQEEIVNIKKAIAMVWASTSQAQDMWSKEDWKWLRDYIKIK